ncbi:hypothetical protein Ahy_B10g101006 isoform A [Arachis hypogaea]|uniref:Delta(3)-Delta(2)-enoyl-CoA isomerase n=1 Tax=Arachis hypogaea TaxID=3818 RepID=A0A444WY82_ARAHY|nr:hypothetical protein Ahy_B10g101006 isoform A [Arachis hypogaea]
MCSLEKRGTLFILTLTGTDGDDQHRLGPQVIASLLSTLSRIAAEAIPGSVLITTAHGRYYSTGFDLIWARKAESGAAAANRLHSMVNSLKPVAAALMALPMPTIAALNGHAAAAGFLLAICHDYVLMRSDVGVLYMPEVDLGLPLPDYFAAMFRSKIRSPTVMREVVMSGVKVKAAEGVKMGMVDSAHDSAESVVEASMRLAEKLSRRKWVGDVYADIRKSLYPDACAVLDLPLKPLLERGILEIENGA